MNYRSVHIRIIAPLFLIGAAMRWSLGPGRNRYAQRRPFSDSTGLYAVLSRKAERSWSTRSISLSNSSGNVREVVIGMLLPTYSKTKTSPAGLPVVDWRGKSLDDGLAHSWEGKKMKSFLYSIPVLLSDKDRIRARAGDKDRFVVAGRFIDQAVELLAGRAGIDAVHTSQGRGLRAFRQVFSRFAFMGEVLFTSGLKFQAEMFKLATTQRSPIRAARCRGLNPLYQIGGPRSIQLALRLVF